jgi:hypothetical protein
MENNTRNRSTYELTNAIIDSTKKFMQALEQGVELGKLEIIRDEVKDLAEQLKRKEAEENQQRNVENTGQGFAGRIEGGLQFVN